MSGFEEAIRSGDNARLVELYTEAADAAEAIGEINNACFLLTHAYIHALHSGHKAASTLHIRLKAHGREE